MQKRHIQSCGCIRNIFLILSIAIASIILVTLPARANVSQPQVSDHSNYIFYLENDIFSGTDRHYTNAIKFSWISTDLMKNGGDGDLQRIPFFSSRPGTWKPDGDVRAKCISWAFRIRCR
jgi:hypothetical protein